MELVLGCDESHTTTTRGSGSLAKNRLCDHWPDRERNRLFSAANEEQGGTTTNSLPAADLA